MKVLHQTIFVFLFFTTTFIYSQGECDGERYLSDVFPNISTTFNIEYGENITVDIFGTEYLQTLYLDIYEPVSDNFNERPLIIFLFGGAFVSGSKTSSVMQELCTRYARMGYVASAIDYRLTPTLVWDGTEENAYTAAMKAIHDLKAAIRYFRMNDMLYDDFGIDTSRIYVGGSSAGAIASVNGAYLNEESEIPEFILEFVNESGGLEGLSGNPGYNSDFYGIVNLCGAIGESDWIEINEAFASVVLAWMREQPANLNRVNPWGGAIAHGHPLGATGAGLMAKMLTGLESTDGEFGLQVMCIGHGMATATVIQRL